MELTCSYSLVILATVVFMMIICQQSKVAAKESDVNYVVWSKNNSYTRGIYTNSTEILKYKCSSSDPRLRELVWVVSCSNDGEQCNERQLSNEDLKRGKKAEGWTVDDVATNETVLKITPRARSLSRFRDNGGMKITCLQYLKGERFASRSAAYHIKEYDVNVLWCENNRYIRWVSKNSTDSLTYKCSSPHPNLKKLEWVITCSDHETEQCLKSQLNSEDLKRGNRTEGWTVEDVATNETVLTITPRARSLGRFRENGGMKIRCLQYLNGVKNASHSAAYHIKESDVPLTARLRVTYNVQIVDLTTGKTLSTTETTKNIASNKLNLTYIVEDDFGTKYSTYNTIYFTT